MNQQSPFGNVLNTLGLRNCEVVRELELDKGLVSKHVSAKQAPSKETIKKMQEHYGVNPDYLLGKSDTMFDHKELLFILITQFATQIRVLENPNRKNKNGQTEKYLYLTLDKNLYKLLLNYKELEHNDFSSDKLLNIYKQQYKDSPIELEEFVLLPKNISFEIVTDIKKKHKYFTEVIDMIAYKGITLAKKISKIK